MGNVTWDEGVELPPLPALATSVVAEVAIVGGGITGLTAAYLLARAGRKVVLIEKDRVGFGATGLTTAFLTQNIDTSPSTLLKMFGEEKARTILDSHARAITTVEKIVADERADCEFMRCPNYLYANTAPQQPLLHKEQHAAEQLGVTLAFHPARDLGFKQAGYVVWENQAKFHPRKYLSALLHSLIKQGVPIFENTELKQMTPGKKVRLTTTGGHIDADYVISATHAPFNKKLFFKKAFYDTYVIEATLPKNTVPEGMYEDLHDPYHYFRVDHRGAHDRLIIGGEDHRSDLPVSDRKSFNALAGYLRHTFAGISYQIQRRWQGPIIESIDGLAWIGPLEQPNIFYATGFSGNGMTYGTIAATLITDLIQGQPNPYASLYDPRRFPTLRHLAYKGIDYTHTLWGGALRNTFRY